MPPRVIAVTPDNPREERVQAAVEVISSGGIAVIPTETFYGLAVDSGNRQALLRLNALKQKPANSPVLLLASDETQARRYMGALPDGFETLAATFWPGPLTMVVPASRQLPAEVSGGLGTVGIRVPGLALPRRIAALLGRPISGVSANLHGQPEIRKAADVLAVFPDGIEIVMDCGPTPGGAPSTVVDLTGTEPRILRRGKLTIGSLRPFIPLLRE